jgi:hypothetical protein
VQEICSVKLGKHAYWKIQGVNISSQLPFDKVLQSPSKGYYNLTDGADLGRYENPSHHSTPMPGIHYGVSISEDDADNQARLTHQLGGTDDPEGHPKPSP